MSHSRDRENSVAPVLARRGIPARAVLLHEWSRSGAAQLDVDLAGQVTMAGGQCLGLPTRQEPRVEPAIVAHADGPASQVHDLHHMRMAGIGGETVVMIASMGGRRRACGHLRDSPHRFLLHRRPRLLSRLRSHPVCGPSPDLFIHCNPRSWPNLCILGTVAEQLLRCDEPFTGLPHEDTGRPSHWPSRRPCAVWSPRRKTDHHWRALSRRFGAPRRGDRLGPCSHRQPEASPHRPYSHVRSGELAPKRSSAPPKRHKMVRGVRRQVQQKASR